MTIGGYAAGGDGTPGNGHASTNFGVYSASNGAVKIAKGGVYGPGGVAPTGGWTSFLPTDTSATFSMNLYGGGSQILVNSAATANYPAVYDVRAGTTFNNGNSTGTAYIPSAASVAYGVPTGTTTGNMVLTSSGTPAPVNAVQINGGTASIASSGTTVFPNGAVGTGTSNLPTVLTDTNFSTTAFDQLHTVGNATTTFNGTFSFNNVPSVNMTQMGGSATPVTNLTNAGASWTGGSFDSGMSALVSSRGTSTFANGGTVTAAGGTIASAGSITASVPNVTLATATAANGSILVTSGTGANQLYVQSGGVEVMSLGINSAAFDSAALATLNIQGIGGGSAGGNNIVVTAVTIGTFGSGTTSLGYGSFSSLHSNGSVTFASFNPGTTTFAALSLTNASSLAGLTIGTVTNLTNAPAGITMGSDATHTWMSNGSATVSLPAINSSGTLSVGSYSLVTGGGSGLTIGTNYITTGSGTITFPAGFGTLTLSNISANDWGYGTRTVNGGTISGGAGLTPTQGKWLEDIWRRTPGGE